MHVLLDDWRDLIKRAWSIRAALALAVLQALYGFLPDLATYIPLQAYAALSVILSIMIVYLRLVKQPQRAISDPYIDEQDRRDG